MFWGEYTGKRVDIDQFLSDTIEMEIYGVKVKTLPPLKAMVQLILHHYKEMNSIYHLAGHDCINYNKFKDVYYLWKNNKNDITLERLYSLCSEYEIMVVQNKKRAPRATKRLPSAIKSILPNKLPTSVCCYPYQRLNSLV